MFLSCIINYTVRVLVVSYQYKYWCFLETIILMTVFLSILSFLTCFLPKMLIARRGKCPKKFLMLKDMRAGRSPIRILIPLFSQQPDHRTVDAPASVAIALRGAQQSKAPSADETGRQAQTKQEGGVPQRE